MPPNTILIGMNHFKGQPAVLALPDEEYPSGLWKVVLQVRVAG
jgi:large subunit ribosomal protein L54